MPLTRIECADFALKKKGQTVILPVAECLKCALGRNNGCNYTYEVLNAMYGASQDRGDNISTTAVITSCMRSEVLRRKTDYTEHPDDMWAAFKGTLTHAVLERNIAPGDWGEVRVWAPVPGYEGRFISCRPDLVSPKHGILWDYKTAKRIPQWGHVWGDQEAQLQVNRWIIDHAVHVGDEFGVKEIGNQVILDNRPEEWTSLRIVYITDETMDVHEVTQSIDVPNKSGDGTHKKRVPDIWSDEEVLDFMLPRYEELMYALQSYPEYIPAIPQDIEERGETWGRKFPCGWCPVRAECKRLALEEGR